MYSRDNLSTFDPDEYGAGNIHLDYLHTQMAHTKDDLIVGYVIWKYKGISVCKRPADCLICVSLDLK